ncbi:MAG: hypothetical protein ACXWQO_06430 [Bdellovibrionota bacterium]
MRELLLALMLMATLAQMAILQKQFSAEKKIVTTRESVKRLSLITINVFKGQDPPSGKAFWESLGRSGPMYDVWGQEFRLEIFVGDTHKEYIWESAGPDRQWGTPDDIKARVPYQRGVTLDLTQPEISSESTPDSKDAK